MNAKALLWDMDGTLLDTAEHHFVAWREWATGAGYPFTPADFAATFGMRNPEVIRKLFHATASDDDCARIGFEKEELYRMAVRRDGTELLPGVHTLLEAAQSAGWKQAIGSSAPRANIELLLDVTGIRALMDAVVSGDDVQRGKPAPDVFLVGAARLDVPGSRCIVLEDAVVGILAARAANMHCVAITIASHHTAESLRRAGATRVVRTLEDVALPELEELLR